jgi:hypothetical protein
MTFTSKNSVVFLKYLSDDIFEAVLPFLPSVAQGIAARQVPPLPFF